MSKKQKTVIIILVVLLALSGAFAALSLSGGFLGRITGRLSAGSKASVSAEDVFKGSFESDYPLVGTERRDVFYEAYPDGKIRFFRFASDSFSEITDVKTADVSFLASRQTVRIKIYYIKDAEGLIGYGLYNSQQKSDVKLYSYIFARVADCPASLSKYCNTGYLMFTDPDAADAYSDEKTYSDVYSVNLAKGTTSTLVSNRDRLVSEEGVYRTDWVIFTDSGINTMQKSGLFASARTHDTAERSRLYDFMTVENSRATKKTSAATLTDSPDYHIWEKDGVSYCFADTETGFDLIKNGDKKNPIKSFDGEFFDHFVGGEWILCKNTFDITNVYSGETKSLKPASFTTLAALAANPSGSRFVMLCAGKSRSIIMYDTAADTSEVLSGEAIYDNNVRNLRFTDDDTFILSVIGEDGKTVNRICKF